MEKLPRADLGPVRAWIGAKHPGYGEIDADTDLIDCRLVDSLDFAELLFLVEELMGRPIDLEMIELDSLRSLRGIEQLVLAG